MQITYYLSPGVERAMKNQEVILRAIEGRLKWYQAAEMLGVSTLGKCPGENVATRRGTTMGFLTDGDSSPRPSEYPWRRCGRC